MIQFPYGIADFRRIRRRGRVYVDRSAHIRDLEMPGDVLVFLRPRRFGKSLWLQNLASYYDLRRKGELDELFGGLAIGRQPTPLAHRYFVIARTAAGAGVIEKLTDADDGTIGISTLERSFSLDDLTTRPGKDDRGPAAGRRAAERK